MRWKYYIDRRPLLRYSSVTLFVSLLVLSFFSIFHNGRIQQREQKFQEDEPAISPLKGSHPSYAIPGLGANPLGRPAKPSAEHFKTTFSNSTTNIPVFITPASPPGQPQIHIVIAHHEEEPYYIRAWTTNVRSIPSIQSLSPKVIIYTKGPTTDLQTLQQTSGAEEVHRLPNVGREGGTYLHHLLSIYDDPPQFVMFTQSYIKKAQHESGEHVGQLKSWLFDRLRDQFRGDTGFMSLDRKHDICYCGHCTDMGRDDFYPLWPQIYTMLQGEVCQELEGHVLSFNGHFIVSRERILSRPKATYEYLKELVDAPESHWIHSEPEPRWFEKEKGKSTPSNPKFGHTLERLWHVLFRCSDPADVMDCDLTGMEAEGSGGCTCRDFPSRKEP